MLGSVPNFNNGAVVAVVMLIPSALSILLLNYLEKFNFRYNKTGEVEIERSRIRDIVCAALSIAILICALSIFLVIAIIPFVEMWPYRLGFSLEHITSLFTDDSLLSIYVNFADRGDPYRGLRNDIGLRSRARDVEKSDKQ